MKEVFLLIGLNLRFSQAVVVFKLQNHTILQKEPDRKISILLLRI